MKVSTNIQRSQNYKYQKNRIEHTPTTINWYRSLKKNDNMDEKSHACVRDEMIKLSFIQKIKLRLFGNVFTERRTRPGWSGSLPFYAFKCEVHGLVEDYPHGYRAILRCTECQNESNT